jgi:hypothetical protein
MGNAIYWCSVICNSEEYAIRSGDFDNRRGGGDAGAGEPPNMGQQRQFAA